MSLKNLERVLNEEFGFNNEDLDRDIDKDDQPICEECGSKMSMNEDNQLVCENCGNTEDKAVQETVKLPDDFEAAFMKKASSFKTNCKKKGIVINMQSATLTATRKSSKAAKLEVVCKVKGKEKIKSIPIEVEADRYAEAQKWATQNTSKFVSLFKKAPILNTGSQSSSDKDEMLENLESILDEEFNI